MFKTDKNLCIYMEGALDNDSGKMGFGLMRFSEHPIVCVIDSKYAGQSVREAVGLPYEIPVVRTIEKAIALQSDLLVLGIAPSGGRFPSEWDQPISLALKMGLSLMNGLHDDLNARFGHLIHEKNQRIWDIRKPAHAYPIATAKAAELKNKRVLMVGTDMAVGKMTAGLELYRALKTKGINVGFVPTGQIGISIMGNGIPLDAIKVDQAAGAVEQAVLEQADKDVVIIEGQGSLAHPGSTASLPLMRGAQPTHLILCHKAAYTHLRNPVSHIKIPPLGAFIKLNEAVATVCGIQTQARTIGMALNTVGLTDEEAKAKISAITSEIGLPVTDVIRFGTKSLVNALLTN